ncbi:uncharacterized protein LOC134247415 [Saccostrea cucullata]|uniref:uncharacterized protein LOC134247415 n=1 Tax=Saccostrea cuccullata TaxID=36930 RepID=UPI002ED070DA
MERLKTFYYMNQKRSRHPSLSSKALDDLFQNHSNITLLNMSGVRSSGFETSKCTIERTNCVVIHCQVKGFIPFGEMSFPKVIEGHTVDVREATCKFALDPLRIGMKIANHNRNGFGTLGGFIDSTGTFNKVFLTCAHVVCPIATLLQADFTIETGRQEERVFDGTDGNENGPVGVVEKVSFQLNDLSKVSVDAALVGIINRDPVDGKLAEVYKREQIYVAGFSETTLPEFKHGEIETISDDNFRNDVIKVGAKTGLTIESLKYENSCARLVHHDLRLGNNIMRTFCNQYEISPRTDSSLPSETKQLFIDESDSEALVFIVKNNNPALLKCRGMTVAFTFVQDSIQKN